MKFDVPDDLIKMELCFDVECGLDHDGMEWKTAAERVRLMLILKKIARQEGIEVDEVDVERRIREKAVEFRTDHDALKAEIEKGGGRERFKDMLIAESTLDLLIEKSRGTGALL